MRKRSLGLFLAGMLFLGLGFVVQRVDLPAAETTQLVEVHGPDIAYVPLTAKYVKYDGRVREVVKFAAAVEDGKENCRCPNCCDGLCYVVVYTNLAMAGGSMRVLSIVWLKC